LQDNAEEEIDITQQEEIPPELEIQEPEPIEEQIIEKLSVVENEKEVENINMRSEADDKTATKIKIVDVVTTVVVDDEDLEPVNFAIVEEKPTFPGGDAAMMQFIRDNIVYPAAAKEIGIQGRVTMQFVIDKNGNVTQVKTAKSVDTYLDAEAERVVKKLPKWSPGKQRGKTVPVTFLLPVNFKLS
jgi:protein TonB